MNKQENRRSIPYVQEYDVVRIILTLLVVVGHCAYYNIDTRFGGIYYGDLMTEMNVKDTLVHQSMSYIISFIYSFHMPAFMALSGSLYAKQLKAGKFSDFSVLVCNKAKRLLISFGVVTVIYTIPIKYVTGYWDKSSNILRDVLYGQILLQGNNHLWYLATLFCEFVVFYYVHKLLNRFHCKYVVWIGALFAFMLSPYIPLQIVSWIFQYSVWFWCGYAFDEISETIKKRITLAKCLVVNVIMMLMFVFYEIFWGAEFIVEKLFVKLLSLLLPVLGMMLVYGYAYLLSKTNFLNCRFAEITSKNSFGIYLYSDAWNYIILNLFLKYFSVIDLGREIPSLLLVIGRFIISFVVSLLITGLLRKCKIKYII